MDKNIIKKKIISILISGREFKFPVSLDDKSPNNSTGLCNQLFEVINTICYLEVNNIYFDMFSKDYRYGELLKLSDILDLEKMNLLNGWNIYDLADLKHLDFEEILIKKIGYVFQSHDLNHNKFIDISKKLIFKNKYESVAIKIIENLGLDKEEVNLVHLRIDKDAEDHISRTTGCFVDYLELYKKSILENCSTNKKLVLLLEDTNHKFVKYLSERYNTISFDKNLVLDTYRSMYCDNIMDGREMYALIDLLIGKNLIVDNYIGSQGKIFTSSFSVLLKYIGNSKNVIMI